MRSVVALFVGVAALAGTTLVAAEKAETKPLVGKLVCSKCTLGETEKCGQALKVTENEKETVYYVKDKAGAESYHKAVCPANKEVDAKVTGGKIEEKDGKKWIVGGKVELIK